MRLGDVEIEILSDGLAMMDGGAIFGLLPKVVWEREVKPDTMNRIPLPAQCLLVRGGGKTILVETGFGSKLAPRQLEILGVQRAGELVGELAARGVSVEDVDIVINTHLHGGHCGGNTKLEDGVAVPTFPRAEYWAQRGEWEDATHPNERARASYLPDNLFPVQESGQLRLIDGNTTITPEMRCVLSPGHTRFHQSVIFESKGEAAIFLGDVAQFWVQLEKMVSVSGFDPEPLVTIETKRHLMEWAVEQRALILTVHSAIAATVEKQGAKYWLTPVE